MVYHISIFKADFRNNLLKTLCTRFIYLHYNLSILDFIKAFIHIIHSYDSYISQGMVNNNLGPDRLSGKKGFRFQLLQTINPVIA